MSLETPRSASAAGIREKAGGDRNGGTGHRPYGRGHMPGAEHDANGSGGCNRQSRVLDKSDLKEAARCRVEDAPNFKSVEDAPNFNSVEDAPNFNSVEDAPHLSRAEACLRHEKEPLSDLPVVRTNPNPMMMAPHPIDLLDGGRGSRHFGRNTMQHWRRAGTARHAGRSGEKHGNCQH